MEEQGAGNRRQEERDSVKKRNRITQGAHCFCGAATLGCALAFVAAG
jgi:hypothetical protein